MPYGTQSSSLGQRTPVGKVRLGWVWLWVRVDYVGLD
jgi:hypothetical protein